jgi:arylsulfatase A-like enzyme
VMRVPLVIRFPESLARGRRGVRIPQLVRTVDLLPTIAAALELPVPPGLDGASLLPAVDEGRDLALSAYGEGGRAFVGVDRDLYLPGVAGKWRMLRTRDWKLIHIPDGKGGIDRLYDLRTDPGETEDVAAEHPEMVARLRRELAPFLAMDAGAGYGRSLSEEEKEQLRALGYL